MLHVLVKSEQSVIQNLIGALLLKIITLCKFNNQCNAIICFIYIFSIFIVVFSLKKLLLLYYIVESYGRKKAD